MSNLLVFNVVILVSIAPISVLIVSSCVSTSSLFVVIVSLIVSSCISNVVVATLLSTNVFNSLIAPDIVLLVKLLSNGLNCTCSASTVIKISVLSFCPTNNISLSSDIILLSINVSLPWLSTLVYLNLNIFCVLSDNTKGFVR